MEKQVYVIGGGAAGLVAAITAARHHAVVTILEHEKKSGQKILATGNGKCNLGNLDMRTDCYHCQDPSFVDQILAQWSPKDTISFFSNLGIAIKERKGYLYPQSEQAAAVRDVLLMEAAYRKVKIKHNCVIESVKQLDGKWNIQTPGWIYRGDSLIIATGSPASNIAGADDSGYTLIRELGHMVRQPLPALVPLVCKGVNTSKWAGVRIHGQVKLLVDGEVCDRQTGELQLTDYGISGIPVFQLSGAAVRALYEGKTTEILVDFFPDMSLPALKEMMEQRRQACPYKSEKEQFVGLLPDKLISILPEENSLYWLKNISLTVTDSKSFHSAQVCSGGVDVSQIDGASMESKLWSQLYFAGEVTDVDGICGGYNLHWAWATGHIAGVHSAQV